jgi:hydrophobe/amphiphile efflux-1 (HAE1) family protein
MNWNISAWSIRQPIPSIVLFLILTVMGLFAFRTLGIDENPNIDLPMVLVSVSQVGAAPAELETQVTRKVEDAVAGIGNIKHINSTVTEGSSSTMIEFELGTSADRATNDVRDAVTRIRQNLPQQIQDPIIQRIDFVGGPFATYTVSSSQRSVEELSWLIDNTISRALMAVPGIGQVNRFGGVDREIRIKLDPTRLKAVGMTADMVNDQIRNLNLNMPGGRGDVGAMEQTIRTLGSAETVEALRAAHISLPMVSTGFAIPGAGGWARLDTLGTVTDGAADQRHLALLNGKSVVSFSPVRSTGTSLVQVARAADKALDKLRQTLPADIKIEKFRTNERFIDLSYHASIDSLVIGAALAVFVIWLFLKDVRAAVISALAMPMSVIPTFFVMKWAGFTLNNMSMLGLALVIGILVDDAIVEIENIVRHIAMGKTPYQAALEAADEIGLAVVATTMTIIVVFVPVAFMGGIPGQFFRQFGLTVAVAVFFSLLVARLITPMMAAYWMKDPEQHHGKSWLMRSYDSMLEWCLEYRFLTLALAVGFFIFSCRLYSTIPTSLVSTVDRGETQLNITLPPGSTIEETTAITRQATDLLLSNPAAKTVFAMIGTGNSSGNSGSGPVNTATIYITLQPRGERKLSQQDYEAAMRPQVNKIAGAQFAFQSGWGTGLEVTLVSNDGEALEKASAALLKDMRTIPGISDVISKAALQRPEIEVVPDVAKAGEQGVTVASIARTALIGTMGDADMNLAKFNLADRQIGIRVQLDPKYRDDIDSIGSLWVQNATGVLVPLRNVATVKMGSGPAEIDRYQRERTVEIDASLEPGTTLGDALNAVHQLPSFKNLPASVHEEPSGDAEIQGEIFGGFAAAMGAAVLFIYAVLVLLFGGFLQPITIMVALPLSIGGALMGLIVTQNSLGMYALIGIVMLMGLATKNSILLVEYCLMSMHKGMARDEAIRTAGEARMRPILMTTVAMIAGMLPIAMRIGAGSEVRAPMAICVIGGLITSTFLTLLAVPVVFTLLDDARQWVTTRLAGREIAPID